MSADRDLAAKCPALDRFPRIRLGHTPTPIDDAPRLGAVLGIDLMVKRDDCTGIAFGGNKVRQLEFYLGAARAAGADCVLITGAVQSNFVRCTAGCARRLGMDIHIQLEERVKEVDETYRSSGNVLLDRLLGAHLYDYPEGEDESGADAALEALAARLASAGQRPYVIHLGIDSPPLGGLGYVAAAAEIQQQVPAEAPNFDAIVVASGSGLTHAGLLVGLRALGIATPIIGVCVRRDAAIQHQRILRRATEIAALIGRPELRFETEVEVTDASLAPGYGRLNKAVMEALTMAARHEGLLLDPVYTGKAMAGLIHYARTGRFAARARVLFVHTGGQPALFGYQGLLAPHLDPA